MYYGPERKSLRLKNYDYNQDGYYFVTICTKNREHFFGEIQDGTMYLSEMGIIAKHEVESNVRDNIVIDSYVMMPNHIHAIIIIQNPVGCDGIAPRQNDESGNNNGIAPEGNPDSGTIQLFPTLSRMMRGLKSRITSQIQQNCEDGYTFSWQRSFFDMIIRTEEQLLKTRKYICDNPKKWDTDSNNT